MIRLSPFNPLSFAGDNRRFSPTDRILVQAFGVTDETLDFGDFTVPFTCHLVNETDTVYIADISGIECGEYSIEIEGLGTSHVTIDNYVDDTVLIQYSNVDNTVTDDAIFEIDGNPLFYDLRLNGGFKVSDIEFADINEQFETDDGDIVTLDDVPTTQMLLTIGDCQGYGEDIGCLLSQLFTCDYVYVNGTRFVFIGNNIENQRVHNEREDMVYRIKLAKKENNNPIDEMKIQEIILRGVGDTLRDTNKGLRLV